MNTLQYRQCPSCKTFHRTDWLVDLTCCRRICNTRVSCICSCERLTGMPGITRGPAAVGAASDSPSEDHLWGRKKTHDTKTKTNKRSAQRSLGLPTKRHNTCTIASDNRAVCDVRSGTREKTSIFAMALIDAAAGASHRRHGERTHSSGSQPGPS